MSGDGAGFEIMPHAIRALEWFQANRGLDLTIQETLIGDSALKSFGDVLPEKTIERCFKSDIVICGPLRDVNKHVIDKIRDEMGTDERIFYSQSVSSLSNFSPIKEVVTKNFDFLLMTKDFKKTSFTVEGEHTAVEEIIEVDKLKELIRHGIRKALYRRRRICFAFANKNNPAFEIYETALQQVIKENDDYKKIKIDYTPLSQIIRQLFIKPQNFDVLITQPDLFDLIYGSISNIIPYSMTFNVHHGIQDGKDRHQFIYTMNDTDHTDQIGLDSVNPYGLLLILVNILHQCLGLRLEAEILSKALQSLMRKMIRTADIMPSTQKTPPTKSSKIVDLLINELEREFALYKSA